MEKKRETLGPLMGEECVPPLPGSKLILVPFDADKNACICLNMGLRMLPRRVHKLYLTSDSSIPVMPAEE